MLETIMWLMYGAILLAIVISGFVAWGVVELLIWAKEWWKERRAREAAR